MIALLTVGALAAYMLLKGPADANIEEQAATDSQGAMTYVDPPVSNSATHAGNVSAPGVRAFLATIMASEGTARFANPYGTFYGGVQFSDFWGHPCETRPDGTRLMQPVPLGTGFTTAAGAYQITLSTWNRYGGTNYYGDFSPEAQDRCAADILASKGVLPLLAQGDATGAQNALQGVWSSFTPNTLVANNATFAANGGAS